MQMQLLLLRNLTVMDGRHRQTGGLEKDRRAQCTRSVLELRHHLHGQFKMQVKGARVNQWGPLTEQINVKLSETGSLAVACGSSVQIWKLPGSLSE